MILNIVPTVLNLRSRGVSIDLICKVCGLSDESLHHLLFECLLSISTWIIACPLVINIYNDMQKDNFLGRVLKGLW